jgi:hypothetical protein
MRTDLHQDGSSEHTSGSITNEDVTRLEQHRYLFFLRRQQRPATTDDIPIREHWALDFWVPILVCIALIFIAVLVYLRTGAF